MTEETTVMEADVKNFEKMLQEKEEKLKESEKRYLTRLAKEAMDAGVSMKEDELLSIGEKGIIALIEQVKRIKPAEKSEKKTEEKAQGKGIVTETQELYEPDWAKGPIKCMIKEGRMEIWQDWDYDYFRGA